MTQLTNISSAASTNVSTVPQESVVSQEADKQISVSQKASCEEEQILALPGPDIDLETTETSISTAGSLAAQTTKGSFLSVTQHTRERCSYYLYKPSEFMYRRFVVVKCDLAVSLCAEVNRFVVVVDMWLRGRRGL